MGNDILDDRLGVNSLGNARSSMGILKFLPFAYSDDHRLRFDIHPIYVPRPMEVGKFPGLAPPVSHAFAGTLFHKSGNSETWMVAADTNGPEVASSPVLIEQETALPDTESLAISDLCRTIEEAAQREMQKQLASLDTSNENLHIGTPGMDNARKPKRYRNISPCMAYISQKANNYEFSQRK